VDDTFLGYISAKELQGLLAEFGAASERSPISCATSAFAALVAECLACHDAKIVALGVEHLASDAAWNNARVLQEALSVGQDPDCRGKVPSLLPPFQAAMDASFMHHGLMHVHACWVVASFLKPGLGQETQNTCGCV
jgi:hypothetical protein